MPARPWARAHGIDTAPAAARTLPVRLDRLDSRDGLSHNTVLALLQDRTGYVWIGTVAGLNRYDGYAFTVFRHRPGGPGSLSGDAVRALAEDPGGDLWVGTDSGLDRYDPGSGTFTSVAITGRRHDDPVVGLGADAGGSIWVRTRDGELFRYDPTTRGTRAFVLEASVSSLAVDGAGTVWVTTRATSTPQPGAVHRYDPRKARFERVGEAWSSRPFSSVQVVHAHSGQGVWMNDMPVRGACRPTPSVRCLPTLGRGEEAHHVLDDGRGRLWIGSDLGLYRYDVGRAELEHQRIEAAEGAWLHNNVQRLLLDRAGTLWIGTLNGLYRYDPHRKPFVNVDLPEANGAVLSLHVGRDGTLRAGTMGSGLASVDPDGGVRWHRMPTAPAEGIVYALHEDRHGTLWAGLGEDLCALEPPGNGTSCTGLRVRVIAEDDAGMMWMNGTGNTELVRFDPRRRRVEGRIAWDRDRRGDVESLEAGADGHLWVGARGLYRCDPHTAACNRPSAEAQSRTGLARGPVHALHVGAAGDVWVGSSGGLARSSPGGDSLTAWLDEPELLGAIVYSILEDDHGFLWMGTSRGLVRFDKARGAFRRYDPDDRPGVPEFNRRAAFRGEGGRLYFGRLGGVTHFDPRAIRDNPVVPPVVLTRATRTGPGGPLDLDLRADRPVELGYRDRILRFEFAALGFTRPSEYRYRYRLEGFDPDWVDAGGERQAVYTHLPPGPYTFRVRASNEDGLWNEEGAQLAFFVTPPWWQTAWFRVLVLLAAAAVLTAAHRLRVAHLMSIERVRARIAGDLHDEVGSGLASIALATEVAGRHTRLAPHERERLQDVARTARQLASDVRDIVWLANPRFDTLTDLVEKMRTTAGALLQRTPCTFVCPDEEAARSLDMDRRRQLFLFFKEALRNVARHAAADRVTIRLARQGDGLLLEVEDDGLGFDMEATRNATGLASLEERARILGGELRIESTPGHGTAVRLAVPVGAGGGRMAVFRDGRTRRGRAAFRS